MLYTEVLKLSNIWWGKKRKEFFIFINGVVLCNIFSSFSWFTLIIQTKWNEENHVSSCSNGEHRSLFRSNEGLPRSIQISTRNIVLVQYSPNEATLILDDGGWQGSSGSGYGNSQTI